MRKSIIVMSLLVSVAGCRSPGLPPEPPEADAANPEAGVVEAPPRANPFERSAFEGVKLDGGGGHEHHHHGHGAAKAEAPTKAEAPAKDPHAPHGGRS
jgi:hypothetical protein